MREKSNIKAGQGNKDLGRTRTHNLGIMCPDHNALIGSQHDRTSCKCKVYKHVSVMQSSR